MALIAVDFDHTLCDSSRVERPPMPGAKEAISLLREQGHKVMIFSCNSKAWIEKWMNNNDIRFDYIWEGEKPVCDVYIDDRAVGFKDWKQALKDTDTLLEVKKRGI